MLYSYWIFLRVLLGWHNELELIYIKKRDGTHSISGNTSKNLPNSGSYSSGRAPLQLKQLEDAFMEYENMNPQSEYADSTGSTRWDRHRFSSSSYECKSYGSNDLHPGSTSPQDVIMTN